MRRSWVDDKTYDDAETPEQTVRTAWDIAMAGGYTAYYYTYTAWDIIRPLDVPKGYNYFKNFSEFWRGTEYWMLQPSDKLVSTGWCLANHDREYVTFQKTPPRSLGFIGHFRTAPRRMVQPLFWNSQTGGVVWPRGRFDCIALRLGRGFRSSFTCRRSDVLAPQPPESLGMTGAGLCSCWRPRLSPVSWSNCY